MADVPPLASRASLSPLLPLAGLSIVVTRARQQGEPTATALRAAGAEVMELPVLLIAPLECRIDAGVLAKAYAAIFVSANAVEFGLPCLRRAGLPDKILIASIGHATTRALNECGFVDVVSPQQSIDSEGLLAMPQLQQAQVKGQHVVLVRGKSAGGGRKLIEEMLTARGAALTVAECYERRELAPPRGKIDSLIESIGCKFAVMALSVETLDSLMKSFAGHETLLLSAALLVPHSRVAAAAASRGFCRIHEIPMSPDALVPALFALKPRLIANTV